MVESIELSTVIPASAQRIYTVWLDSVEHGRLTGAKAEVDARVGGKHTAWDGYIEGEILELDPNRRIVQSWRSSDFPPESGDSRLEVLFEESGIGTRITLRHTDIPEGQALRYKKGWFDFYFEAMKEYFAA